MIMNNTPQIYVNVDIGCRQHSVAIGLPNGDVLDEFAILHHPEAKAPKDVNTRAKIAMMAAVDKHRKCVPGSQCYYEKKRIEGKSHNQAIRALGRQLCRIIFRMLKQNRAYEMRTKINENT